MSATSAVLAGRRMAVSRMIDRCIVTREDEDAPVDEVTGERPWVTVYPNPEWPETHPWNQGPALSQSYEAYEKSPEAGGHTFTEQRYSAHFPATSFMPQVGDVIEWTVCPLSPARVGTKDRISAPFDKTYHTAIRVPVDRTVA